MTRRLLTVFSAAALALAAVAADPTGADRAARAITAGSAIATVERLSSPEFAGRLTGTEGHRKAALWMAEEARKAGLAPPSGFPGYLQPFPVTAAGIESAFLELLPAGGDAAGAPQPLVLGKDYMPMLSSATGEVTAEVIFAGFGITAPDQGRDDYAGLDVRGKIVMVLRGEPRTGEWKDYHTTLARTRNAAERGAAAFLLVDSPVLSANEKIARGIPEAMVSEVVADALLDSSPKVKTDEIRRVMERGGTASFPTGRTLHFAVRARPPRDGQGVNVVALLPGSDRSLAGEYVAVGAHLDHIGDWPALNPGADDNASGSAALLEAARAAAAVRPRPRRTIAFVWFGGEELGLLGADWFARHPPAGLARCVAVLNMDMVGAGTGLYVAGGQNFPEIQAALEAARDAVAPGAVLKPGRLSGEARADHAPFFDLGVHAVSLFGSGGSHHGYHTPEDTVWWVTPKTIEAAGRIALGAAWRLADSPR